MEGEFSGAYWSHDDSGQFEEAHPDYVLMRSQPQLAPPFMQPFMHPFMHMIPLAASRPVTHVAPSLYGEAGSGFARPGYSPPVGSSPLQPLPLPAAPAAPPPLHPSSSLSPVGHYHHHHHHHQPQQQQQQPSPRFFHLSPSPSNGFHPEYQTQPLYENEGEFEMEGYVAPSPSSATSVSSDSSGSATNSLAPSPVIQGAGFSFFPSPSGPFASPSNQLEQILNLGVEIHQHYGQQQQQQQQPESEGDFLGTGHAPLPLASFQMFPAFQVAPSTESGSTAGQKEKQLKPTTSLHAQLQQRSSKKRKYGVDEETDQSNSNTMALVSVPGPKVDAKTNSMLIKKRCRTKLDNHLKMLADQVPGSVESICWKKPFRNQILVSAVSYIRNLQLAIDSLKSQVANMDKQVDTLIRGCGGMALDESVLREIQQIMTPRANISLDDPQVKIMSQLIGSKAFLLNQLTGKLYFFSGPSYTRFDVRKKMMDTGYPRIIALANWPGVFPDQIDAACHVRGGFVYFFSGNQFIKYDLNVEKTLPGYPRKIDQESWPGLSFSRVDACVNWENGKLYFFSGKLYCRFDLDKNMQDPGYPKLISEGWKLLGALFPDGVDSAVSLDGKAYFLKGHQCVRYDLRTQKPDHGKITIDDSHPLSNVLKQRQ